MDQPTYSLDHLIAKRLPDVLRSPDPHALVALHGALVRQQRAAQALRPSLIALQTPEAFAMPLLASAIKARWGVELDPRQATLHQQWRTKIPVATLLPAVETHRYDQNLLAGALHNFEEDEGLPGAFDSSSQLRDEQGQPLAITPWDFAAFCRTLDIGQRYQAHLNTHLQNDHLHTLMLDKHRADLAVALEEAVLRGQLTAADAALLRTRIDGDGPSACQATTLHLLGKPFYGAVGIVVWSQRWHCYAYLPGDPVSPLTRFDSWEGFFDALGQRLHIQGYPGYLQRFICERDRPSFTRSLARALGAVSEGTAVALEGRYEPVACTPAALLTKQQIQKLHVDGRTLAVPTGDEDRATRQARLDHYLSLGLDLLAVAALFVPALNTVMLGVAAVQIADEVYEGYEAWEAGDREEALRHLFSVAADVAVPLALAGTGVLVGKLLKRSSRVARMLPVLDDSGRIRLGLPDTLEHPQSMAEAGTLVRQLDVQLSELTDDEVSRLLRVTGLDTAQVRRLLLENASPPARLLDAWERLHRLEREPGLAPRQVDEALHRLPEPASPAQLTLQRHFPGLTARCIQALIAPADSLQLETLTAGRVPLVMAEQARLQLRDARLDRAFAGRALAAARCADSDLLAEAGVTDRQHAAQVLGMSPPLVAPGVRHGDGRLGYPLSGRGVGAWRAIDSAVRQLYPTFSFTQVQRYVEDLRAQGVDIWEHIALQRQRLTQLETALGQWQEATLDFTAQTSRGRVASRIRRCWRRQSEENPDGETSLILENERLGELPDLPEGVDFSHVSTLTLRGLGLGTVPEAFLSRFGGVRQLDLSGNRLAGLPSTIARLTRLEHLDMARNMIRIGPLDNHVLGHLGRLEVLDLSHNLLGLQLDLSSNARLRIVRLRGCGLFALPPGLLSRMALESADLRDNLIVHLSEGLFNTPPRIVSRLEFHDNPLNVESRQRLSTFQQRNGLTVHAAHAHGSLDDSLQRVWLQGLEGTERTRRAEVWQRLVLAPGSADFFRLIADLRQTADFLLRGRMFRQRVWAVIEACEAHASLRQGLFELAARPRSCGDSVALNFSLLETRAWVEQATQGLAGPEREEALVGLGRALHRLDEVDRLASLDIQAREARSELLDEVEVRLAYRVGLSQRLGLPGQPVDMMYFQSANVSRSQLQQAGTQVLEGETPQALAGSLSERPFWLDYLQQTQQPRLAEVDAPFHERLERLDERQSEMSDGDYLSEVDRIAREREAARQAAISALTQAAVERNATGPS